MAATSVHDSVLEKSVLEEAKANNAQLPTHSNSSRWSIGSIFKSAGASRPSLPSPASTTPKTLRPTAYLDGLRGFAAFLVYIHHHQLWAHDPFLENPMFETAYGWQSEKGPNHHFIALPFVRVLFGGGHFAVSVFFVMSGYVLSAKPIKLIHAGEIVKVGDNIASALFRRWIRLYIPLIATTILFFCTWHIFGLWVPANKVQESFSAEVANYAAEFANFSWLFRTRGDPWFQYNFHTWSIPTEFMGSIIIYTSLLAFSRCTVNMRLCGQLLLMWWMLYIVDGWYGAMFMSGQFLCELDILAAKDELPTIINRFRPYKTPIVYTFLVISLYLGGVPSHTLNVLDLRKNPGWYYLSFLDPMAGMDYKWFYLFWAAWMMVVSAHQIGWLRGFFETRFCQYLGRISFSLYLVHGPVIWTLGHRMYVMVGMSKFIDEGFTPLWSNRFPLPQTGPLGMEISQLVPNIFLLPLTLWLAELACRWFDEPSVKFSQWLYVQVTPAPPAKHTTT